MRKIGWARGYIPSLSPVFDCIFDCKYRPGWESLQVWWCQVERRYIDTWNAVPNYSRPQTQTRLVPNPMKNFEPLAGKLVMYALLLQARPSHFHKKGNGPVYCVHKPYPTGMQLDRWLNQVSHNRLSITHCKVCTLLRSIIIAPAVGKKMSWAFVTVFHFGHAATDKKKDYWLWLYSAICGMLCNACRVNIYIWWLLYYICTSFGSSTPATLGFKSLTPPTHAQFDS